MKKRGCTALFLMLVAGAGFCGMTQKAYNQFDQNKDGMLSIEEYINARAKAFSRMDANQDGQLDDVENPYPSWNKVADTDKNGTVSLDEFLALNKKNTEKQDVNKDGLLSFEEVR